MRLIELIHKINPAMILNQQAFNVSIKSIFGAKLIIIHT